MLDLVTHDPVHLPGRSHPTSNDGDGGADPLGGRTPEVDAALGEATAAMQSAAGLRQAAAKLLSAADEMLTSVMDAVNNGLSRKIAETNNLKVHKIYLLIYLLIIIGYNGRDGRLISVALIGLFC